MARNSWECGDCGEDNDLDPDAEEGQIVECCECGAEFEITRVEPLALEAIGAGDDDDATDDDWED